MVDAMVLPAFIAVILVFLLPPGPDMAYMLAVGLEGGRRAALKAILGIGAGMSVYAAAAASGMGTVARSYPWLLDAVKILGAAYLLWLAYQTVRCAHRTGSNGRTAGSNRWFLKGVASSLSNPKIILFYLAVLPQFIGQARHVGLQMAMLGAVNVASEVLLYGGIGMLAGVFHARFTGSRRPAGIMSYLAGTVYLALAVVIGAELIMR